MKTTIFLLIILAVSGCQSYGGQNDSAPPIPSQEEPEVLNEGPIHEAFAQPVDLNPQAGIIAPNEPPTDIIENPAGERPQSSDYVWIPGYWAWDSHQKDYIWASGCWRKPPAGMSWMPGYWNKVPEGWQWVAGFWIPTSRANQIEYLPEPPELVYSGPPADLESSDNVWVPPCYYWWEGQYILRPGYWLAPQPNWIWVPSHYTWTPYGYVFVTGYWDNLLATRGVLYAPVYFPRHFHRPPGFVYSLGVVVDTGNLEFSLFSYPSYCHYYFGDYYSDLYIGIGIYPWFDFETYHSWYDPIFVHDRWRYRGTIPHWGEHIRHEYALRRDDRNLRPPRTYRDLERRISNIPVRQRSNYRMVEPLKNQIERKDAPIKFSQMNEREHEKILEHAESVNNFRRERKHVETDHRKPGAVQRQGELNIPERTAPQRAAPERRAGERATPERTTPQRNAPERTIQERGEERTGGRSSVQMRTASPSEARRQSVQREPSERQVFRNRRSSEQMNFSRSPVTGRNSRGLFGRRTPSQPDGESRIGRDQNGRSRNSRRDRG